MGWRGRAKGNGHACLSSLLTIPCYPDQCGSLHSTGPPIRGPKLSSALPPAPSSCQLNQNYTNFFLGLFPFLPFWQQILEFGNCLDFFSFILQLCVCVWEKKKTDCPGRNGKSWGGESHFQGPRQWFLKWLRHTTVNNSHCHFIFTSELKISFKPQERSATCPQSEACTHKPRALGAELQGHCSLPNSGHRYLLGDPWAAGVRRPPSTLGNGAGAVAWPTPLDAHGSPLPRRSAQAGCFYKSLQCIILVTKMKELCKFF